MQNKHILNNDCSIYNYSGTSHYLHGIMTHHVNGLVADYHSNGHLGGPNKSHISAIPYVENIGLSKVEPDVICWLLNNLDPFQVLIICNYLPLDSLNPVPWIATLEITNAYITYFYMRQLIDWLSGLSSKIQNSQIDNEKKIPMKYETVKSGALCKTDNKFDVRTDTKTDINVNVNIKNGKYAMELINVKNDIIRQANLIGSIIFGYLDEKWDLECKPLYLNTRHTVIQLKPTSGFFYEHTPLLKGPSLNDFYFFNKMSCKKRHITWDRIRRKNIFYTVLHNFHICVFAGTEAVSLLKPIYTCTYDKRTKNESIYFAKANYQTKKKTLPHDFFIRHMENDGVLTNCNWSKQPQGKIEAFKKFIYLVNNLMRIR